MKTAPWILLLVGLAAGACYIRFVHDPYVRKVADLEKSRDSLNAVVSGLNEAAEQDAAVDRARLDSIATLNARVTPKPKLDSAIHQGFVADTVFVRELPDSLKPKAWALVARKDTIIAELASDRASLLGVIALMGRQIATRDSSLVHTRLALLEALKQRDHWRQVARPSLPKRILREVPKVVVFVGVGWVLHHR